MCKSITPDEESLAMRRALGRFPTGVGIVTTLTECGVPVGLTINSFSSISMTPPLIGWCIDRRAGCYRDFYGCKQFTITILEESQGALAHLFATKGIDRFAGLTIDECIGPVIPGGCASFECAVHKKIPLGDHLMLIGKVTHFTHNESKPLVFVAGKIQPLGTPRSPQLAA